jgi:hypothetical protein
LVSRRFAAPLHASEGDSLIAEHGDEIESASQRSDIALQGLHLAVVKVDACFQPRDVALIDTRRFLHIHLGLSRGVAERA